MRSAPPTAWLLLILFCGLCLRLALFPAEGYGYDVHLYKQWSQSAAQFGPSDSYVQQIDGNMTPDYPPFSLLLFWGIGKTAHVLPSCTMDSLCLHLLVKLPGMLSDLAIAMMLYYFLLTYVGTRRALFASATFTFNPVTWYDSAVWGQTDSFYTMMMLGCLILFAERQWFMAGAYSALAITTKLQSIIMFPLLPFLLPFTPREWFRCAAGAFAILMIILLPFMIAPDGIHHVFNMYIHSIGKYPVISANAYNFWWSLLADSAGSTPSSTPFLGFLSYRLVALSLTLLLYLFILIFSAKTVAVTRPKKDRAAWIFLTAGTLCLAFFLFNTEMHERYSFPFVALFLPVIFLKRGYTGIYIAASAAIFINILGVLPAVRLDRWLFATFPTFDVLVASILLCTFFILLSKFALQASLLWKTSNHSWHPKPLHAMKKKLKRKRTR